MKTAIEIIEQYDVSVTGSDEHESVYTEETVTQAMQEYAAQFQPQWIKIKSETDLPNSDDVFWIMLIDGTFWPASYYAKLSVFSKDGKLFTTEYVTHYAPIIKPSRLKKIKL